MDIRNKIKNFTTDPTDIVRILKKKKDWVVFLRTRPCALMRMGMRTGRVGIEGI